MRTLTSLVLDWLRLVRSPQARPYLLITLFVDSALIFVFLVAIQSYLPEQHGGGAVLPGYALAAYGAAKLAAQLFGGRLIDRVGGGLGLFVGLALIVLGQGALLAAALAPEAVLPAAAVYGLGSAVLWPAVYTLASTAFTPMERARLTSAMTLTTGFAVILGLGLGLALPASFPYTAAMVVALAAVVLALLSAGAMRPVAGERVGWGQPHAASSLWDVTVSALSPQRLGFAVVMLLQSSAVGALIAVFRSYGRDLLGVSFRQELLLLAPAAVLGAGAVVVGGVLADRLGRAPLLASGFLTAGLAIWLLSTVTGAGAVIPLAAASGMGFGLAFPSVGAMSMDLSRAVGRGTLLAWFMTMEGLGHTAGPAMGAWVNGIADPAAVLQVVGTLFVIAAAAAVVLLIPSPLPSHRVVDDASRQEDRLLLGGVKEGSLGGAMLWKVGGLLGLAVAVLLGLAVYWAMAPSSQVYGSIATHGLRDEKLVALTFDDGPNDPWTLRIADVLDGYGVKATFFVVGKRADAYPEEVRALVEDGHLVGNHSYHHRKRDAILELNYGELGKAEESIAKAAGVCPALFRPPNGFHTPWQLHAVSSHQMRAVGWDVQPSDWERLPAAELVRRVVDSVRPGSIVLLHDGNDTQQGADRSATLEALPGIIEGLRAKGYRFVRVDELLSVPPYLPTCAGLEDGAT
jgi:peptidoglycan/xylan/chitin deacetylase (PgdA/CDA1 family)/predicted MFS family arabinose efflux permease